MKTVAAPLLIAPFLLSLAAPAGAQDASPRDQELTIRQSVQEVLLDVTVRDGKGKIVKNLKPGDIQILEDGVRQDIRSFKLVLGRESDTKPQSASAQAPSPAARPAGSPLRAVNLICIVFSNLDPVMKQWAIHAVQDFLKINMQPEDWVGVFNLGNRLTPLQQFTRNRSEIMDAANRAFVGTNVDFASVATAVMNASPNIATIQVTTVGNPATGGTVSASMEVTGGELNQQVFNTAEVENSTSANRQRGDLAGQRLQFGAIEGMRGMDQIDAMVKQLAPLPGHKSVLLMCPGLATVGDPEMFKAMVDRANKAGVTIYGVDVNGLSAELDQSQASTTALKHAAAVSSTQTAMNANAAQMKDKMHQGDYVADAVRTTDTQSSLRALAEGTGGFLVGSTNDLRKSFQRLVEDVDTHYEIIYHPASDKYDGRLRTIEVKPIKADWKAESRTGYFALPALGTAGPPEAFEMTGLAALNVPKPPHFFDFRAAAYQFRPRPANSQNDLVLEIPVANLQATPLGALKRYRLHVAVLALIKDANGQVVDKFSQDSPYEIPEENMAKARSTSITFTHPISLPAGHYSVEIAALDREAGRASTGKIEFDSPEHKGVGLSSVLLVQNVEPVKGKVEAADPLQFQPAPDQGRRVIPALETNIAPTANPYVFFIVYPDASISDKPKIQAEFLLNGTVLAKQVADLPAPDSTGAIPMVINTAAKPGDCELRITAMQGNSSAVHSVKYTIGTK
ncbi:MAG TPA: VWA domain-containing protein [Bryobacteraceae bacterium]|nr:VWA domain-containing protein [Bryobacteraceae bacterium]